MGWHIDFETYSACDLKKCGMFRYSEDPSTIPILLAFANESSAPVAVDLSLSTAAEKLTPLFEAISSGELIGAHNAQFEWVIWPLLKKLPAFASHTVPTPKPHQWDCTAARARLIALPGSLKGASEALGLATEKDPRGEALIKLFSIPQKTGERILPRDRPSEFREFMRYCEQDVAVERELSHILPPMPEAEREAFCLDYTVNSRGFPVNLDFVRKANEFVEAQSRVLVAECESLCGIRPTQVSKLAAYMSSNGYRCTNFQAATVTALLADPSLPPKLANVLNYRVESSRAGVKKLKAILDRASLDGRIRGGFMFSAATTRRWSSLGVQLHNLQKPEGEANPEVVFELLGNGHAFDLPLVFERPMTVLSQCIRGFLEAPDMFLAADYSAVEARGLFWLSGEEYLLEAYRNGEDVYKKVAGLIYACDPTAINAKQRFMGKQLVLGCNYGMGAERFTQTTAKFGHNLALAEAQEAVYAYRNSVPTVPALWKDLECSCLRATVTGSTIRSGKLSFRPHTLANGFELLYVDMPSGSIAYPLPRVAKEQWNGREKSVFEFSMPRGSGFNTVRTFGGSLAENITQALTRDILRDGMVAADKAGFRIVGHVHDEVIVEGHDDKKELEALSRVMCTSSPWAKGLPLKAEGYISKRYRK